MQRLTSASSWSGGKGFESTPQGLTIPSRVSWGATAGYLGGRIDAAMMRFVDIVYALPYVFIVIILSTVFPRGSLAALFIAIGAVGWLTMARIVRGQVLQ
jgi:oligopeptide transport system permease protein